MTSIAVLGAGAWGSALALLLSKHGVDVRLWAHHAEHAQAIQADKENKRYLPGFTFPDNLQCSADMQACIEGVDGVLSVVPSHAFRDVLVKAKQSMHANTQFAWASKGLDPSTHSLLSAVAQEILGEQKGFGIVAGPSFAKEVSQDKPTAITLAHNDESAANFWQEHLHGGSFRVYTTEDVVGAQLGGAVKNVLAIATGIADGLGLGANTQAALITRGLTEMMRLGLSMGAQTETFMGLAGMGDLVLTCTDNQSRNRRYGRLIGSGVSNSDALNEIDQVVEGIGTTKLVHELAQKQGIDMPITEQVFAVLYQKQSPQKAVEALLSRKPKAE